MSSVYEIVSNIQANVVISKSVCTKLFRVAQKYTKMRPSTLREIR